MFYRKIRCFHRFVLFSILLYCNFGIQTKTTTMKTNTTNQKLIIKKRAVKNYSTTKSFEDTNPTSLSISSSFF